MESIIDALFYNKYEVHTSKPVSREYLECSQRLDRYHARMKETMGEDFFDGLYAATLELLEVENRWFFQKGIQLGGQIMMTILGPEADCYSSSISAPYRRRPSLMSFQR